MFKGIIILNFSIIVFVPDGSDILSGAHGRSDAPKNVNINIG